MANLSAVTLPPAIELILSEGLHRVASFDDLQRRLQTSLYEELASQAEWTLAKFDYRRPSAASDGFVATPAGSLNPFSPIAKCREQSCVARDTQRFARTVALYSDSVVVPDPLSGFIAMGDIRQRGLINGFHRRLLVLRQIEPLLRSGVLSFGPSLAAAYPLTSATKDYVGSVAADVLAMAEEDLAATLRINAQGPLIEFSSRMLSPEADHVVPIAMPLTQEQFESVAAYLRQDMPTHVGGNEEVIDVFLPQMTRYVREVLGHIQFSYDGPRSTLLAGSSVDLQYLGRLLTGEHKRPAVEQWAPVVSLDLPWLSDLSVEELLVVRERAGDALPRLRALLAAETRDEKEALAVVADLRSDVARLESEMLSMRGIRESMYRAASGSLALAFVLYGLGTGVPGIVASSLAAVLATLAHLQGRATDIAAKEAAWKASPSFALVEAKRILKARPAA